MEIIPFHPLIQVSQDEMARVRHLYNLDSKQIQENIEAIEEWIKKQDHLVEGYKYMSHTMVERLNILARGSVEATKIKINKLFTARAMMPELIHNRTVEEFEDLLQKSHIVLLPKLDPGLSRVFISKFTDENLDNISLLTYFRYCILIAEFRFHYEYSFSDTYIIDLEYCKMNLLTKLNPNILKKAEIYASQVYVVRLKGLHFVNAPPFVDRLVSILKKVFSPKVANRFHVHSSYEKLHEYVSKEILPKDYGGNGPSISETFEQWKDYVRSDEGKKILEDSDKLISDESKRNCAQLNEELLGLPGSYKQLNLD